MSSSHDYVRDKRNENIKIYINGRFYPRNKANISVFDSGFLLGDGVWSGIRLHNQKLLFIKEHLKRLKDDAKQIGLKIHLSKKELEKAIYRTTNINKMKSIFSYIILYFLIFSYKLWSTVCTTGPGRHREVEET